VQAISSFRVLAVLVIVVLAMTLAAPARAEALEPLTIVALASLAVVGVILVVYLIVANVADSRRAEGDEARYVACIESDTDGRTCWAVRPAPEAAPTTDSPQGG
jgi:heme/copper-type cytochrome/quinol oxidase subunit 2